jgi:hypothetical protein
MKAKTKTNEELTKAISQLRMRMSKMQGQINSLEQELDREKKWTAGRMAGRGWGSHPLPFQL